MATLILEQADRRRGGVLNGRIVIGRRANNHITIRDRSVSRIHAWIGATPDGYFIADTASRTGTKLNGEIIRGRRPLRDGDEIEIGPARIKFHSNGALPTDMEKLDLTDRTLAGDDGIFVDCACGAPIWVPWDYAGRAGRCRDCDRMVQLPDRPRPNPGANPSEETMAPAMSVGTARHASGSANMTPELNAFRLDDEVAGSVNESDEFARSAPIQPKGAPETFCGACQSPISMVEETTRCPECGVAFHTDCWTENGGCSSYGCKQVGILIPPAMEEASEATVLRAADGHAIVEELASPAASHAPTVQWGYLLLPVSVLAALASIMTFGGPSLLVAFGIVARGFRRPDYNRKLNGFALLVSIVGAAAGSGFSTYWWIASRASGMLRP